MKKVIGKLVLLTLCALIVGSMSILAQVPQPQWIGVNALMPQAMYWSAVCSYDGKIYVFGGNANDAETNTTYIYDTASDTWTQGANMPTPRYLCTAVEVGGKMYVMGGRQLVASLNPVDVNECYDPATDTWTTKTKMPNAIRGHAACAANNKIYVLGGNTGLYTDTVSIYDPTANTWAAGTKMPAKAAYGGVVYSSSQNSLFWVGGVKSGTASASNFIGKVFAYSLTSNSWDTGTAMPDKTAYLGIATDDSGNKVYISGGSFWYADKEYPYPGTVIFNTATKTFEGTALSPPSPANRVNSSAVFSNGNLYLLEGEGIRTVDQYTIASDEWYEVNHPIGDDSSGYAFISGGAYGGINGKFYVTDGLDAWEYDPPSNMWTKKYGQGASAKSDLASGVWDNKLVLYGGYDDASTVNTQAYVYDPLADTFTSVGGPNSNINLLAPGAVLNGKFYVPGGRTDLADANSQIRKLSILDLNSGSWSSGADLPVAIEQASCAAYNNKIYLFGGIDNIDPDFVNEKVYIYDPAANSWTTGPSQSIHKQAYGAVALPYGNYILVDSGYNLWYNDTLAGLSGGSLGDIQAFDPAANTFTELPRPFGKTGHSSAIIDGNYYSTAGGDGGWIVTRLDIANFGGAPVCTVTCSASANPNSGQAPLPVNFTGSATASNCTGTPAYAWTFGDSGTSTEQNPSHIYQADGTYNWSMTATVDSKTCSKSGTVTVGGAAQCTVTCNATATASALNGSFTGTTTATNCTGTPTYAWTFGDGGTSTEQNPTHAYTAAGSYDWALTVTVDDQTCSETGTLVVGGVTPPTISSVSKVGSPFRLKIAGTGFVTGCTIKINGVAVPETKFKTSTSLVAKKGANLKAMVPKGTAVTITVTNPDGGVSNGYTYTRP